MRPRPHPVLAVFAAALIVVALVLLVVSLRPGEPTAPEVTPAPGIVVTAKAVRTIPEVTTERRRAAVKDLAKTLKRLYVTGFVAPAPAPERSPAPVPPPSARIRSFLTKGARVALKRSPEVFDAVEDLSIYSGSVTFGGVVTFDSKKAVDALLEVDVSGQAAPIGASAPRAKVRQQGTVHLERFPSGWLISSFDLKLVTRPLITPTPSPR